MSEALQDQIAKLRTSLHGLEAQRGMLGDAIVGPALAALCQQLAGLEEQAATQAAPAEERRLITILFLDIVGSTGMAERLDPEEWRQVVQRVHAALGEAVTAHHGMVAQYLGDGLLSFFGAHEADEHDPENAVRAALEAQTAVANLPGKAKVQLRTGVHSGPVVVGELGTAVHREFTASGDAVNLAARLQTAAPPGGVLISHDTYRYVRGVFDFTPRPPLSVKGKAEPIQTYLVRRVKPHPFRSTARGVAGVETRTVGREAEMRALQAAYLRAYEGHGVVWAQLLSEPGVGKSRLLEDMSEWIDLREETTRLLRARAHPDDVNQPFALVRRLWFDRFQIAEDAPLEQAEHKWVERFKEFCGQADCEEAAHALGLLVGLPFRDSPYIKAMRTDPAQVKGRAYVVSRNLTEAIRRQSPMALLLEDLQWTDAASWEYFAQAFLGGEDDRQPNGLFILGAARPEWHPPQEFQALCQAWPSQSSPADQTGGANGGLLISLEPLTRQATHELACELLRRAVGVPEQVFDLLVERSEGVPYFTEEMVNWFVDRGILDIRCEPWRFLPERLKEQPLPFTLQHLLLTRLGSLTPPERAALQRGAIYGRHFWTGGVEALGVPVGEETLEHLQPRGFIEAQPESVFQGETEWAFHHHLLQEVTYESVLKRERAALHRAAAGWLEWQARKAGRLDEFAGLLGEHRLRAGELSAAADWYLQAGRQALRQGAPREAERFHGQALELLPPVDRARCWQAQLGREEALSVLGDAAAWRSGIAALLELARTSEDERHLAEAYLHQALCNLRTGDDPAGEQASREALAAARRCGNEAIETKALALIAVTECNLRDQSASIEHVEEALRLARRLGDDKILSFALFEAAYCYDAFGNFERATALQTEQVELDHRLGNRLDEAMGLGNMGHTYGALGLYKQGRASLEQAIAIGEAFGARRSLAYYFLCYGMSYLNSVGDLREARRYVERALIEISPSQDARGKIQILSGLGKIRLKMGDAIGATRRLTEARELALSKGISSWAFTVTSLLAASKVMQGQLEEARTYATEAWTYLREHGWKVTADPVLIYRYCAETFDALQDEEHLQVVLESGHRYLMEIADTLSKPEWRQSFLENLPDNRDIMEMWERRKRETGGLEQR